VADANVQHFIFSTLPPVAKATGGALKSPHFDIKAEHEEYARSLGIPATFFEADMADESFYSEAQVDTRIRALVESLAARKRV